MNPSPPIVSSSSLATSSGTSRERCESPSKVRRLFNYNRKPIDTPSKSNKLVDNIKLEITNYLAIDYNEKVSNYDLFLKYFPLLIDSTQGQCSILVGSQQAQIPSFV